MHCSYAVLHVSWWPTGFWHSARHLDGGFLKLLQNSQKNLYCSVGCILSKIDWQEQQPSVTSFIMCSGILYTGK